ncbi:hypothetical protein UA75_30620 [Actinoalloteichus sp. GBA129-24]|uniref:Uncharacterized protein n=1 Tax=Actinoalloteichus fjordicus TaxID=1612552 RepID=A0AAC9PV89_9PSEU|nr:hypothetical protein UA74_30085 [Actinoalloteichus fjordicus]APU24087.1 hypothetical protein UA75_30620 [Actinoalloteichus sp. GBA129-24]
MPDAGCEVILGLRRSSQVRDETVRPGIASRRLLRIDRPAVLALFSDR